MRYIVVSIFANLYFRLYHSFYLFSTFFVCIFYIFCYFLINYSFSRYYFLCILYILFHSKQSDKKAFSGLFYSLCLPEG